MRVLRAGILAALVQPGFYPAPAGAAELVMAVGTAPSSLPIYLADAEGFFTAEGLTVKIIDCAFGKLCLRMMLDGKAQLCTAADLPIVLASFGSDRFAIVATLMYNRNDTKVVARKRSGIRGAADLMGRKVGTYLGTTSQYALDSMLLLAGADPARVELVGLKPGEGRGQLLEGSIDALALFEPYAYEAAQALGSDAVVIGTQRSYAQTWNLLAAAPPRGPAPAEIQAVLRALERANRLIRSDPARAKALLRERRKMDPGFVDRTWAALEFDLSLNQSLLTLLEGQGRWARRAGLVSGPAPNFLNFIDSAPLRRVLPDAVSLAQ